jgi:hypothetical protein
MPVYVKTVRAKESGPLGPERTTGTGFNTITVGVGPCRALLSERGLRRKIRRGASNNPIQRLVRMDLR